MVNFSEIIQKLVSIGFYDVFLPFILVYAVIFAILEKSKIFSGGDSERESVKNVNSVIAFVFGLFVVASIQTVKYLQGLITNIIVFIIFILVVLILLAFIFGDDYTKLLKDENGKLKGTISWTITSIILIISISVLFSVMRIWDNIMDLINEYYDSDIMSTIIILVLVGGIIIWITTGDNKSEKSHKDSKGDGHH